MQAPVVTLLLLFSVWLAGGCTSPQENRAEEPDLSAADKVGLGFLRLGQTDRYLTLEDIARNLPIDHKILVPKNQYPPMLNWSYNRLVDGPEKPFILEIRFLGAEFNRGAQQLSSSWQGCTNVERLSNITGIKPHYVDIPMIFDIPPVSMVRFSIETPHMRSEVVGYGKDCISRFSIVKRPI